ncbi:MAG: hypothetical protein ACE5JU_09955 [Candidatus Binatia bacterium]
MTAEGNVSQRTATIAAAASLSGEIDLEGFKIIGIVMPAAWTAANLTFQAADVTGGTFQDVFDDAGTEVTVTVAAARYIGLDATMPELAGIRFLKIRSGTSAVPVNQAAARTLTLILKG